MTSTGAHLSSGQSCKVDMRPLLFNRFAVRPPDTFCEVKRILCLAGCTVTGKVKLWDQVGEPEVVDV